MKLCIVLLLFCGCICYGSEIWYQTEMSTYLVPPFQSVYTTLQQNIFDKLLTIDSNSLTTSDSAATSFVSNLYCEVDKLIKYLDASVAASNNIRTQVDFKLISIVHDIAAKENEIARTDNQIRDVNTKIQTKQSQINAAEQSVRQAESSVGEAENALRRAEQEVQDAQLCAGLFGRRKRFLGNLWNSIQTSVLKPIESAINTAGNAIGSVVTQAGGAIESAINSAGGAIVDNVVKPVCGVINFQQIDNARRNVENKKNELSSFKNQVQTLKNDLNSIQNDLIIYSAQLYNLNNQLNQLKDSLIALPNEQHIILSINQKLTDTVAYLRTLFSGSTSFLDTVASMIDVESLVKPLNAVYDELQRNQFLVSLNTGKISMEKTTQVKVHLQALITSISNVSINMGSIRCPN